ncbi:mitochondrial substrate carrier family protein E [Acrasis kona]|uniref:Mitochondrial substrate carrier family protein E n=1 Tax=Acrasis kona TaxID=1008807 RepID=A0AAW2YXN8_9EUKA
MSESKQSGFALMSRDAFIASSLSGIISRTLLHPVDTIKARMQVQKTGSINTNTGINSIYGSTFDAAKKIYKYEGYRGFYRGLLPSLFFSGPAQTLYLTSYEVFKSKFSEKTSLPESSPYVHLASGFFAEAVSCVLWVPHDVIKERLQVQRDSFLNVRSIASMIRADGVRNLYKGYWITLGSFGPYSALYFYCYEKLKDVLLKEDSGDVSFGLRTMLAASVASGFSAFCTTPLDVVKTRFQVQRRNHSPEVYENFVDAVKKINKHEGLGALWKGVTARVAYSAPNAAIIMSLFDQKNVEE